MGSQKSWWEIHRPTKRKLVQLYGALLYNAHLRGFKEGQIYTGKTKALCVPGFNCYSCPGAVGACPLGALQNAIASSDTRIGWYVLGILLLFGAGLGRTICGWLCPLGLLQELLHKIPTPKGKKNRITRVLSCLKYVILAVFVIAIPFWYGVLHGMPVPGFCKYICPAGTFEGAMGLLAHPGNRQLYAVLGILFTRKFVIMLVIGLCCIFWHRAFCRFICPLGAIYGMFNRISYVGMRVDANLCNHCGSCVRSCPMDIRRVGDHECIHCTKCMRVCHQKALSLKAGKLTLIGPESGGGTSRPETAGTAPDRTAAGSRKKTGRIAWGAALLVLCAALLWFNVLDPSVKTANAALANETAVNHAAGGKETGGDGAGGQGAEEDRTDEKAPAAADGAAMGAEEGMILPDFTAECVDGTEFHLADTRGKVVFINLWATWCGPCVAELPLFDALYREHRDDICVLAIHSPDVTEDVPAFLEKRNLSMPFAVDGEDRALFTLVNGTPTLPQTLVLDREGKVIYNRVGSATAELLEDLYRQASGEDSPGNP